MNKKVLLLVYAVTYVNFGLYAEVPDYNSFHRIPISAFDTVEERNCKKAAAMAVLFHHSMIATQGSEEHTQHAARYSLAIEEIANCIDHGDTGNTFRTDAQRALAKKDLPMIKVLLDEHHKKESQNTQPDDTQN